MDVPAHKYFRVDLQDRLPAGEVQRRQAIKKRLESQFERWQTQEQHFWLAITRSNTISFLGLDWSYILPNIKNYVSSESVAFALLSELQLCTFHAATPDQWLYEGYRRYSIRIQDFGSQIEQYLVPLIEATAIIGRDPALFEDSHPDIVARMLPQPTSSFRLVIFPQTRYSFIEDKMFHALYPLPEEQVNLLSHKLLKRFQGNNGYYNALPYPFTDFFTQKSYRGKQFRFLAAMYPVIEFEFVADYENRKRSERFVTSMQKQSRKGFPLISQWRYSRKFDFTEESQLRTEQVHSVDCPERMQSGRGLFEYACGDLDTLNLDCQQTSLLEEAESKVTGKKYILVVEPLWLLLFPESNTLCAFKNERNDDLFREIWGERIDFQDCCQVLIQLVNKADKCMGDYEPMYRKRLAKLQYRIYAYATNDHHFIKSLSNFVAELTILLDPLQAQINILRRWQQWQSDWPTKSQLTDNLFEDAIKIRQDHLDSLKRLQERARELQALLFQLNNTETAYFQSQLAIKMAQETKIQVELAKRTEHQNKSILIFTIITIIFLPLSFFTSYFGMNTSDIRNMDGNQAFFWLISAPISIVVIIIAFLFAFRDNLEKKFKPISFSK